MFDASMAPRIGTPGYDGWVWSERGWVPTNSPNAPQVLSSMGGPGSNPGGAATGLGWNLGTGQLAVGGLTALGNLWNSWQAAQLGRDSFNFQKRMGEANLANSIQSYNTQLADRARARGFTEGQNPATTAAYIDQNRLPPR